MVKSRWKTGTLVVATILFFGGLLWMESTAWARAGGGGSSGSRGSRSFSTPRAPSSPTPSAPRQTPSPGAQFPGSPTQPGSGGWFSRSPFLQGMAGGLAGGLLGNMLFGGRGYASPMGGGGGGGIGLLDLIIIGLLIYFGWRFFKKRRAAMNSADPYGPRYDAASGRPFEGSPYYGGAEPEPVQAYDEVERGFAQIRQFDPGFEEESFKEKVQDLFFRIQAAWMNRSLDGIENLVTQEMADYFRKEFASMKQQGIINRLENIAVRKVEPSEVWQEMGKDYVTVLFTANLLDYTVDEKTNQVVQGDRLNPVKFQEFWTFVRDIGSPQWKLSAIQQADQPPARLQ